MTYFLMFLQFAVFYLCANFVWKGFFLPAAVIWLWSFLVFITVVSFLLIEQFAANTILFVYSIVFVAILFFLYYFLVFSFKEDRDLIDLDIFDKNRLGLVEFLHDDLNPLVLLANIELTALLTSLDKNNVSLTDFKLHIRNSLDLLNKAYSTSRDYIKNFNVEFTSTFGLVESIEHLVASYQNILHNCIVEFRCDNFNNSVFLTKDEVLQVFRIIQESLLNAIKHSSSTLINITLNSFPDGSVNFEIADNGIGIGVLPDFKDGAGLRLIRKRVEHIGGVLSIRGSKGIGTTISVVFSPSHLHS